MPSGVYPIEKRRGLFQKGHPQLNTGRTHIKKGDKLRLGAKHSEESKQKMSVSRKGTIPTNIEYLKTYKRPRGKEHHSWRGGKVDESKIWRKRIEYINWRKSVYFRDGYKCRKCGLGGRLNPHHIETFHQHIEKRFDIDNGITFCESCHKLFHKLFGRKNLTQKKVDKFIKNN